MLGLPVIAGVVLFIWFSPVKEWMSLDNVVQTVEKARVNPWAPVMFYAGFVICMLAAPVTIFPIIGGVLFNFWVALPLNMFAATLGAWLAFQVARLFGRGVMESLLKGKMKSLDRWTGKKGVKAVFLLRWVGVPPFTITNYALGLSAVRNRDFWIGTFFGILPWMALVTYMANSLWEALLTGGRDGLKVAVVQTLGPLTIISVGIVLVVFSTCYIRNRRRQLQTQTAS